MRNAVLLVILGFAVTANAAPSLKVESLSWGGTLDVRLVAPSGAIVWTCQKTVPSGQQMEPCEAKPDWYQGPGTYVAIVSLEGQDAAVQERSIVVAGSEESITWDAPYGDIVRTIATDPRIRLAISTDHPFEAELTNGSDETVFGAFNGPYAAVQIEQWDGRKWIETSVHAQYSGTDALAPGETRRLRFGLKVHFALDAGRYRALVDVRDNPNEHSGPERRTVTRFTVASDAFDFQPGSQLQACLAEPDELTTPPAPYYDAFVSLHTTKAGVLLLKGSGELVRVDDGSMPVIARLPPGSTIQEAPNDERLLAITTPLRLSRDGGVTFTPLGNASLSPDAQVVFAGSRLLRFDSRGDVAWIAMDGTVTPIQAPVKATWRAAAFRDEQHGVLIGDCSVLIETEDGGITWKSGPAPWVFTHGVAWDNGDLLVYSPRDAFRRRRGQTSFEKDTGGSPHSSRVAYSMHRDRDPQTGVWTIEIKGTARRPDGSEVTQNVVLKDPPFAVPTGFAPLADGSLLMMTTPSGLFRIHDNRADVILSTSALAQYQQRERAMRERMQRARDAASQGTDK